MPSFMEMPHTPEASVNREQLAREIEKGKEQAIEARTAWTDVLLYLREQSPANDVVVDDRTFSYGVAEAMLLSKIDELSTLEAELSALEAQVSHAA